MKAFISYKWENESHVDWVRHFATDLRCQGIDAILDQWEVRLGESFSTYMSSKITMADAILFVITPDFVKAAEAPQSEGSPVQFEVQLSMARHLHGQQVRLIGVYRSGDKLPAQILDNRYIDFRDDTQYHDQLSILIRDLLGDIDKPALAESDDPSLELARRIQYCWEQANRFCEHSFTAAHREQEMDSATKNAIKRRAEFKTGTQELISFYSSRSFLFPDEIKAIVQCIFADLMDFEFLMDCTRIKESYRHWDKLRDITSPKIGYLHHCLKCFNAGDKLELLEPEEHPEMFRRLIKRPTNKRELET